MRIALISDIHGNHTALQAVLADLRTQGADKVIFLGDAATIGTQPVESLDALKDLGCAALIMGNHDAAVLEPERASELQVAANLHSSLQWCLDKLRPDHFDFLRGFKPTFELPLSDSLSLLCYHGSPLSYTDQIVSTTPEETLDTFFAGQRADLWTGGHTHIQMQRRHGKKIIVNPGSVGNAFHRSFRPGVIPSLLPWAEYALLSVEGETVSTHLRRVPFDTGEVHRIVKQSGSPSTDWWLEQYN